MNEAQYAALKKDGAVIAAIGAGATITTDPIPIGAFNPEGIFNLCVAVSGANANLSAEPLMNLAGVDDTKGQFLKDIDGYLVLNAFTEIDGRDGNGKGTARVVLGACKAVKFELTNSGASELTIDLLGFSWQ